MGDEDITDIVEALDRTDVYVGEGASTWIEPQDRARVQQTIDRADLPVKVVLVVPPDDGGIHAGEDLLVRLHDAGAPDGLYLGVNNVLEVDEDGPSYPWTEDREFHLAVKQWGAIEGRTDLTWGVDLLLSNGGGDGEPYELGPGLVEVTELLAEGDVDTIEARGSEGLGAAVEQSSGSGSADGDGPPLLGVGALVLAAAAVVLVVRRRRRTAARRPRQRSGQRGFTLPDSVLDRVREAEADSLRSRGRRAVTELGEHIDAAEMSASSSSAAVAAWQATLDHYEAASRLLPAETRHPVAVLDAVGALVLAQRGEEALAAARAGRAFVPRPLCFLNPLHGRGSRSELIKHGDFRATAPLCAGCRRDLRARRRPDILTVRVDGHAAHYFETGHEPWASTGYGALDADLIGRLRELRRGSR